MCPAPQGLPSLCTAGRATPHPAPWAASSVVAWPSQAAGSLSHWVAEGSEHPLYLCPTWRDLCCQELSEARLPERNRDVRPCPESLLQAAKWGRLLHFFNFYLFIFKDFYSFIHERDTERGRDPGRGRRRPHVGSPMGDSILGLQDHALGRKAGAQLLSHPGIPIFPLLKGRHWGHLGGSVL